VPHLNGQIFTAERLKREFSEIPDALDVNLSNTRFSDLFKSLMMGAFTIDFVRAVAIHSPGEVREVKLKLLV
jgi:hypothetical protein